MMTEVVAVRPGHGPRPSSSARSQTVTSRRRRSPSRSFSTSRSYRTFPGRPRPHQTGRADFRHPAYPNSLVADMARHGIRSLIVRFGDFFGPKPGNNWFSQGMVTPKHTLTSITYPGRKGVGHSWAYLPDAGDTFAQLMQREAELEAFARFHFPGYWDADGTAMIEAIRKAAGNASLRVKALPWFILKLASPFK